MDSADTLLILPADMPLLTPDTLRQLMAAHARDANVLTLLTSISQDSAADRLIRDGEGHAQAVVEAGSGSAEPPAVAERDTGVCCVEANWLWPILSVTQTGGEPLTGPAMGANGDYGLGYLLGIAAAQGQPTGTVSCLDESESLRVDTRVDLAAAEKVLRGRTNRRLMEAGVTMLDPDTTYIDATVSIGADTLILPNTYLFGRTTIGANCRIGPNTSIEDSQIADGCRVYMSVLEASVLEEEANIGPFGHLRKGSRLCRGAHMGNFGEMKNSTLGPGAKMGHFSYLGDATIGADVNIGCGTITCNFDGERKHPTVVEDGAFIGSDTMLVAPLHVGAGARTGAGSVVTRDVPPNAVVYGVPARVRRTLPDQSGEPAKE